MSYNRRLTASFEMLMGFTSLAAVALVVIVGSAELSMASVAVSCVFLQDVI